MDLRVLTVSSISNYVSSQKRYVTIPIIRLQGKWLEKLNFATGDKVEVMQDKEQLVIKLIKQ